MLGDNQHIELQGLYNTLYNSITRPDHKFVVTRYFIDEWVPLLGPSMAWLVVGLRQQCFRNQRRDWCIVDKETLSNETALDERTIERCMKKPLSDWFVVAITHRYRYRHQIGKKVRDKNRYQLLLDEPLSPRHQIGLAAQLRQLAPTHQEPLESAMTAVKSLAAMPDLIDKISYTGRIPKDLPRRTILQLVEETLSIELADHVNDARITLLDQACAQLYNLIIQPNKIYVGWQYFRLNWVRLLGHALAWTIIYLRRHCYWDQSSDELRDKLTYFKKDLAAGIGQTPRNLANLMENPHLALFLTTPEVQTARNKPTLYEVRMVDEPLTPTDQQQVSIELKQRLQGQVYGQDPENGQLNLFPMLDALSSRQNFAYGQLAENMPDSDKKKDRLDQNLPEKMSQHDITSIGKNAATLKDSLIPHDLKEIQKQQLQPLAAVELKKLVTLLDDMSIQEPTRSKLLGNPNLTAAKVGAWFLYAETQPGLFDPRAYVIKRILADDSPPPEFLSFANLDDSTWTLFEDVAQALRGGQPPQTKIGPEYVETFVSWAATYGELTPDETRRRLSAAEKGLIRLGSEPVSNPRLDTARKFWQTALEQLSLQMTRETFNNWLKQTEPLEYRDNIFVIDAKNEYAKDWLEHRLARSIERTLTHVIGKPTTVRFTLS